MNRIITEEDIRQEQADKSGTSAFTETVKKVAEFDFRISRGQIIRELPFLAYVCLLVILFIYNGHRIENKIRENDRLTREIKELRSEYISALSRLMGESKQSAVAKKLAPIGIKELKTPPEKITVNGN
jgi:galactokinase